MSLRERRNARNAPVGGYGAVRQVVNALMQNYRFLPHAARVARNLSVLGKRRRAAGGGGPPKKPNTPLSSIKLDGTTLGKRVVPKRRKIRRKKKTLKQRIATLEKEQPADSTKLTRYVKHFKFPQTSTVNYCTIFEVKMTSQSLWETIGALNSMGGLSATDFTAENTSIAVKNLFMKCHLTNATTTNCILKYMWVRCKDDTNESYLDQYTKEAADRGLAALTVSSEVAESGTSSAIPARIVLTNTQRDYDFSLGIQGTQKDWLKIGKVENVTIGPGDSIDVQLSHKYFKYLPEAYDQASKTYVAGHYDYHLICLVKGDLAHDATNHGKVGYSNPACNVEAVSKFVYEYSDGKGLRQINSQNTLTSAGFTIPNHVDNFASAVEGDAQ